MRDFRMTIPERLARDPGFPGGDAGGRCAVPFAREANVGKSMSAFGSANPIEPPAPPCPNAWSWIMFEPSMYR